MIPEGRDFWKVTYQREKRYPKDPGTTINNYASAEEVVHHIFKSSKHGGAIHYKSIYDVEHSLYQWAAAGTTENFTEWLKTGPEVLGKSVSYWQDYVGKIEKAAAEGRFRIYSTHRGRVTSSRVKPPEPIVWPHMPVEEKRTPAYEKAIFKVSDIPDEWELQLSREFTDALDAFNRPWKHDGILPRGRCMYWESGWLHGRTTSVMPPDMFAEYKARLALFERLWGRHRYKDPHYPVGDPRRNVDTGGWVRGSQLKLMRRNLFIEDSDLERYITGIRRGKASTKACHEIKFKHLPVEPDENWAWLFGMYFSGGSVYPRKRYNRNLYDAIDFRFRMQEDVVAGALEILSKIGSDAARLSFVNRAAYLNRKKLHRTFRGRRTKTIPVIQLSWPEYLIMRKMGLHEIDSKPNHRGTRTVRPRIPDWIKEDDVYMKAFMEGFMNGPSTSANVYWSRREGIVNYARLYIRIRCYGTPEGDIVAFIGDMDRWLRSKGVMGRLHQNRFYNRKFSGMWMYDLNITKLSDIHWLGDNLEILKADTRAGILLRLETDSDPFLYEALRDFSPGQSYVLGSLLEEPQNVEELAYSLPMSRESVTDALKSLRLKGLVDCRGPDYIYEPSEFKERILRTRVNEMERLNAKRMKYSMKLLNQCVKCNRIYITPRDVCGLCGSEVRPVLRTKILKSLKHSAEYIQKIVIRLKERIAIKT